MRLARNNTGLKLLQYIRDEAHRFAQHYHHILRRKSQLEEDVKQGRRPPRAKPAGNGKVSRRRKPAPAPAGEPAASQGNPHSTIPSLPILSLRPEGEAPPDPRAVLDSEDTRALAPTPPPMPAVDREEAEEKGIQPTHTLAPRDAPLVPSPGTPGEG